MEAEEIMSVVTADLAVSLDGIAAGHDQSADHPFGHVGHRLHEWMSQSESADVVAEMLSARAYIMGRNMFGPDRGAWDLDWTGWWGPEPPYRAPVFVLCSRPRPPLPMQGGTTFTFVTDGIEAALAQAREAAEGGKVAIAGGATTINEYLSAGLIDELRLHVVPVTMGDGVRIFDGLQALSLTPLSSRTTPRVTHLTWRREA